MATYYVDPTAGNNSNDGLSFSAPFKEMIKAHSVASAGDTVRVKSGNTREPSVAGAASGVPDFAKALVWVADDGAGGAGSVTVTSYHATTVAIISNVSGEASFTGFSFYAETIKSYGLTLKNAGAKRFTDCAVTGFTAMGVSGESTNSGDTTFLNSEVSTPAALSSYPMIQQSNGGGNLTLSGCVINSTGVGSLSAIKFRTPSTKKLTITGCTLSHESSVYSSIVVDGGGAIDIAGCQFENNGDNPLISANAGSAVSVVNSTITMAGGGSSAYVSVPGSRISVGDFVFTGNTVNLDGPHGAITISRSEFSSVVISGNTFNINSPEQYLYTVWLRDINVAEISGNTFNNLSTTESTSTAEISCYPQYPAEFSGGVVEIAGNTFHTSRSNGLVIMLGEDTTSGATYDNKFPGSIIANNYLYGRKYNGGSEVGTQHAILVGHQSDVEVYGNILNGVPIGIVWKSKNIDCEHRPSIHHNVFINCFKYGILAKGPRNLDILNNIFYNDAVTGHYEGVVISGEGIVGYLDGGGTYIKNNIFKALPDSLLIFIDNFNYQDVDANYNIYNNSTGSADGQGYYYKTSNVVGFSAWKTATSLDSNSTFGDALFSDQSNRDFHLNPTSPCIGAGTAIAGIASDIEGNQLYQPYNIGPYGAAAGALTKDAADSPGRAKYNLTPISNPSDTTIVDANTYSLANADQVRKALGWTYGVDHWAYSDAGVAKVITGATIKATAAGPDAFADANGFKILDWPE